MNTGRVAAPAGAVALAALGVVAGCVTRAYQPLEVRVGRPIDAALFDAAAAVVASYFPSVAVERDAQRMQSDWEGCVVGGGPAQRRVAVFRSAADRLALVVEYRRLEMGLFRPPRWSAPRAHAGFERQLGRALEAALRDDGA